MITIQKFKKFFQSHFLAVIPLVIICLVGVLFFIDVSIKYETVLLTPLSFPLPSFIPSDYPVLSIIRNPVLTAESAILVDDSSKVILYEKNPGLLISPASTTKIMTALIALNYFKLTDILIVQHPLIDPVVMGFYKGQQVTFENLLYAMMLPSANDAALTIADNYPGGEPAFVAAMNEKAQRLHLNHTHFADPIGLLDDGDYTTVIDLSRLTSIAIQNPIFAQVVNTKYYTVKTVEGASFPVKNLNELLGTYGVNGVKTGYTAEAKQVLVTSIVRDGHTYISVVMGSDDRFVDTRLLLPLLSKVTFQSMHL